MLTVYKYEIPRRERCVLELPDHAEILHFGRQLDGGLYIWALVDTDAPMVERTLDLVGTGHEILPWIGYDLVHHGSVEDGPYVRHLFGRRAAA